MSKDLFYTLLVVLALSPLLFFACPKADWPLVLLCTIVALLFLEGATLLVDRPTPRFLTSAAWLVLLLFGLAANQAYLRYAIVNISEGSHG